ncbi:MAG: hypothetical protein ACFFBH_13165 [Promethearchaeota archaeon]
MKEKNILSGIILSDLICFISYLIFPSGLIYVADIQMLIGDLWGTYFALKYLKKKQNYFKNGIAIGLGGASLSAISIFLFNATLALGTPLETILLFLLVMLIEAIIVGLIAGALIGYYFVIKEGPTKKLTVAEKEFYDSLKDS